MLPNTPSYAYNSECSSVVLHVDRGGNDPYHGRRISTVEDSPLLLEGASGEAIHYLQDRHHHVNQRLQLTHFQLRELYFIIYYSFGATQMLPIFQTVTTIAIQVSRCQMACLGIMVQYLTPNVERIGPVNYRISHEGLYSDVLVENVCLENMQELILLHTQRYLQRQLSITRHSIGDNCTVTLDINPFVSVNNLIDSYHLALTSQACCDDVSQYYYVIWRVMDISWLEAASMCSMIGGKLPSAGSREETSLLEQIMLGSRFSTDQPSLPSPHRLRSKYGIFISQVCAAQVTFSFLY